jgi:hypothetical protein
MYGFDGAVPSVTIHVSYVPDGFQIGPYPDESAAANRVMISASKRLRMN